MKVMILTVSTGYGHTATANAIADRLTEMGNQAQVVDVYKYINSFISETLDKSTTLYTKVAPDIYRVIYDYLEGGVEVDQKNVFQLVNKLCAYKFFHLVKAFDPDVIVCTHLFAAQLAHEIKRKGKTRARLVGIITDYTIHPYWETVTSVDYIITASEMLTLRAVKRGIPHQKILPFGIPVHPKYRMALSKYQAREKLGLKLNAKVILLMGGGLGFGIDEDEVRKIFELNSDCEVMAVCGRNEKQRLRFEKMKQEYNYINLHPYGFVDNVQEMMDAADFLISKPGGLSVSEALAKNLPMIVINPIAGHEERNLEFLLNSGVAIYSTKTFPLDEAVNFFLQSPRRLETIRESIAEIAKPDALEKICDFLTNMPLNIRSMAVDQEPQK